MRFRPGAFHAFWCGEMADLQDKVVPLTEAFPWADAAGVASILGLDDEGAIAELQALIRGRLPRPDQTIALINEIIGEVETDDDLITVAAVAAAYGKRDRWLQQVFRDYLGINLKWLLQRKGYWPQPNRYGKPSSQTGSGLLTTWGIQASSTSSPIFARCWTPLQCNTRKA